MCLQHLASIQPPSSASILYEQAPDARLGPAHFDSDLGSRLVIAGRVLAIADYPT